MTQNIYDNPEFFDGYSRLGRSVVTSGDFATLEDLPADSPSGLEALEANAVLGIIRGLPEAYRETLLLRLVEGMTGPEIAARTGLTPGSVRVNLHRGMTQLKEKLHRRETHG